jgi:cell division protein ZapB
MSDLKSLETKINTLIETCKRLAEENQSLNSERTALLEKNALAKTHIENMIKRLKILEEDQ